MKYLALVLVLLWGSIGCVPPAPAPRNPQRTSAVINLPKEKVWPRIVAEIGMNYPIQVMDKDSGFITTQFVMLPAGYNNSEMTRWVYDPSFFLSTWGGLRVSLRVMAVEKEPSRTTVTITSHYEAFERNVTGSWRVADTNGSLENAILTKLESPQ